MMKRSPIWDHFKICEDEKYASCNYCNRDISRGGRNLKTYNTTNIVNHLKSEHKLPYTRYCEKKAAETERTRTKRDTKQLSLEEANDRVKEWAIHDPRADRVHRRIGEMVALDNQPFSIVEDPGFCRLVHTLEPRYHIPSRKFFSETVIPRIKRGVEAEVRKCLDGIQYFSFTTDAWSTQCNNASLLGLTAHWITDSFERRSSVLNAVLLEDSHTAAYICEKLKNSLSTWNIKDHQVHLFVRDNASNMIRAMSDAGFTDLGCFAHTLQLVVHDGVLSQRAVLDMLALCRRIVGHFKHSSVGCDRLRQIQQNLALPQHKLKQDVPTRWNSSLYMLQSVVEQKMALAAYATEHDIPLLTSHQLDLADKVIAVLSPVEEITQMISTETAAVSVIIPVVRGLMKTLEKHNNDSGVRTMKGEMLTSLKRRFADMEDNEALVLATILDPRYKNKFFCNKEQATDLLIAKYSTLLTAEGEPSSKRCRTEDNTKSSDFWDSFSEMMEESGATNGDCGEESSEVTRYLNEPLIHFQTGKPYIWWFENMKQYPLLSQLTKRYLSAPPTSVSSERLFSCAGELYDDKRNRLTPENAEVLLFIKNNFQLIDGQYIYTNE